MKNFISLLNFFGSVFTPNTLFKNGCLGNSFQASKYLPKQFLLMPFLVVMLFGSTKGWGQISSAQTGDWNQTSTWVGGVVPTSSSAVRILPTHTITVTADASCTSIEMSYVSSGNSSASQTSTLSVNSGFTLSVSGALNLSTINTTTNSFYYSKTANIQGLGTLSCGSISVGSNVTPIADRANIMNSTISNLNCSGALTIYANDDGSSEHHATFNLQTGTFEVASVSMTAENAFGDFGIATLSLASGAQSGTLKINAATPFSTSGTGTIIRTLNGTSSTVEYNRVGDQTVLNTTYRNLTIINSGVKTTSGATTVSGILTVNSSATLATTTTLTTTSATVNINGSFQINQGGFASGGTWTYGAAGTLIYNNSSGSFGENGGAYWPTTSGPVNVTVSGAGGVTMNVARTVSGTFTMGATVTNGSNLTLNGTTQINGGNFTSSPTYGGSSTLVYNTTYGTSFEWTGGASTSVTAGSGIPANVQVLSGTVTLAGGRGVPGNVTVTAGGLVLNATSGDLYIGGNLTHNGTTWTNNGRAVFFVGTGTSVINSSANSGVQFFDYLVIQKSSGAVQIGSTTSVTLNTTTGSVLQFLNAGSLDLNGRTLTLNNAGGNILVHGAAGGTSKSITSSSGTGTIAVTNSKTASANASGTLSTDANVIWILTGGMNYGGVTTINGKLQINSGGFINTNAPIYGSGSTLIYNSGTTYGRGLEWSATSGAGYPHHVTLQGNTTLDLGNGGLGTARQMAGNLTVTNGSTLTLNNSGNVMTAALTVVGSVNNNLGGTITLSSSIGGDIKVEGDIIDNGTFNFNNRAVFFQGNNTQSIQGSGTFDIPFVRINKGDGSVKMLANLTCIGVNGANAIEIQGTTSVLDLNGFTLNIGATGNSSTFNSGITTAGYIKGSSSSNITILGSGTLGTLLFDQSIPGTTNVLNNLTVNRNFATGNDLSVAGIFDAESSTISGAGAFTLSPGATLKTASATGIDGSITVSGTKTFSNAANYEFYGSTAQTTGSLLPATVNNFTISNTAGVTLPQSLTVNGAMSISGTGTSFTINPNAILTIAGSADFGGKSVTLKSDASGTAAIGQVNTLTGATNVTVERYIPAKRAWRLLTAPLIGSSANTISNNWQGTDNEGVLFFSPANYQSNTMIGYTTGGSSPNIYKFGTTSWSVIPNLTSEPLFDGVVNNAFLVYGTGPHNSTNIASGETATTLKPKGGLITGSVTYNSLLANKFKLIGNPYASPINPVTLVTSNPGYKIWIADPSMNTSGGYATYDGTNWTPSIPSGVNSYIQSGQGFFVRKSTDGSFSISETHKVSGSSLNWFERNASAESADKIRVLLFKQDGVDWKLADGILAVNSLSGVNDVDEADANKMSNFNENIMFRNGTNNLSIEYKALPTETDLQQLRITNTSVQTYQLRIHTEEYQNSTLTPVLEDTLLGTFTPIPTDGSEVTVLFTGIVASSANPDNRFRIVYQSLLGTNPFEPALAMVYPNPAHDNLTIQLVSNSDPATFSISNLVGQVIKKGTLDTLATSVSLESIQQGFYLVTINQNGRTSTSKIFVY